MSSAHDSNNSLSEVRMSCKQLFRKEIDCWLSSSFFGHKLEVLSINMQIYITYTLYIIHLNDLLCNIYNNECSLRLCVMHMNPNNRNFSGMNSSDGFRPLSWATKSKFYQLCLLYNLHTMYTLYNRDLHLLIYYEIVVKTS